MNVNDILGKLVINHHVPVRDFAFGGAEPAQLSWFMAHSMRWLLDQRDGMVTALAMR